MQHHEPVSCEKKLFAFFEVKVTASAQNIALSTISSELLIPWQPNLVSLYSIINQNVLWKKRITAFKVKVTAKGQIVSICPDDVF